MEAKPSEDFESATASLSTVDIDGAEADSDFIQITYRVNLKTGKTQHIDTTPSSQEHTTKGILRKHVRSAPEMALNHNLPYDFFVIYCSSASEWVFHCLLGELEDSGLKGCVKDRDFKLGKMELTNYLESIENSVCTIIVITKDFETNNMCSRGMHHAIGYMTGW